MFTPIRGRGGCLEKFLTSRVKWILIFQKWFSQSPVKLNIYFRDVPVEQNITVECWTRAPKPLLLKRQKSMSL